MSMEIFKAAVDEFAALGGKDLNFCVTIGEPLLDTKLLERARYVRQFKQFDGKVGFYTTLQWLHKFDLKEFFESGIQWLVISTSLSGPKPYNDFFGVKMYAKMLENLKNLLTENKRRKNPIEVTFSMKPTDEDQSQIPDHPDFKSIQSLTSEDLRRALKTALEPCDTWGGLVTLPAHLKPATNIEPKKTPCNFLFQGLTVFSNGAIGACFCRDVEANSARIVGKIGETTLLEAWQGAPLTTIRKRWIEDQEVPEICKKCVHYDGL